MSNDSSSFATSALFGYQDASVFAPALWVVLVFTISFLSFFRSTSNASESEEGHHPSERSVAKRLTTTAPVITTDGVTTPQPPRPKEVKNQHSSNNAEILKLRASFAKERHFKEENKKKSAASPRPKHAVFSSSLNDNEYHLRMLSTAHKQLSAESQNTVVTTIVHGKKEGEKEKKEPASLKKVEILKMLSEDKKRVRELISASHEAQRNATARITTAIAEQSAQLKDDKKELKALVASSLVDFKKVVASSLAATSPTAKEETGSIASALADQKAEFTSLLTSSAAAHASAQAELVKSAAEQKEEMMALIKSSAAAQAVSQEQLLQTQLLVLSALSAQAEDQKSVIARLSADRDELKAALEASQKKVKSAVEAATEELKAVVSSELEDARASIDKMAEFSAKEVAEINDEIGLLREELTTTVAGVKEDVAGGKKEVSRAVADLHSALVPLVAGALVSCAEQLNGMRNELETLAEVRARPSTEDESVCRCCALKAACTDCASMAVKPVGVDAGMETEEIVAVAAVVASAETQTEASVVQERQTQTSSEVTENGCQTAAVCAVSSACQTEEGPSFGVEIISANTTENAAVPALSESEDQRELFSELFGSDSDEDFGLREGAPIEEVDVAAVIEDPVQETLVEMPVKLSSPPPARVFVLDETAITTPLPPSPPPSPLVVPAPATISVPRFGLSDTSDLLRSLLEDVAAKDASPPSPASRPVLPPVKKKIVKKVRFVEPERMVISEVTSFRDITPVDSRPVWTPVEAAVTPVVEVSSDSEMVMQEPPAAEVVSVLNPAPSQDIATTDALVASPPVAPAAFPSVAAIAADVEMLLQEFPATADLSIPPVSQDVEMTPAPLVPAPLFSVPLLSPPQPPPVSTQVLTSDSNSSAGDLASADVSMEDGAVAVGEGSAFEQNPQQEEGEAMDEDDSGWSKGEAEKAFDFEISSEDDQDMKEAPSAKEEVFRIDPKFYVDAQRGEGLTATDAMEVDADLKAVLATDDLVMKEAEEAEEVYFAPAGPPVNLPVGYVVRRGPMGGLAAPQLPAAPLEVASATGASAPSHTSEVAAPAPATPTPTPAPAAPAAPSSPSRVGASFPSYRTMQHRRPGSKAPVFSPILPGTALAASVANGLKEVDAASRQPTPPPKPVLPLPKKGLRPSGMMEECPPAPAEMPKVPRREIAPKPRRRPANLPPLPLPTVTLPPTVNNEEKKIMIAPGQTFTVPSTTVPPPPSSSFEDAAISALLQGAATVDRRVSAATAAVTGLGPRVPFVSGQQSQPQVFFGPGGPPISWPAGGAGALRYARGGMGGPPSLAPPRPVPSPFGAPSTAPLPSAAGGMGRPPAPVMTRPRGLMLPPGGGFPTTAPPSHAELAAMPAPTSLARAAAASQPPAPAQSLSPGSLQRTALERANARLLETWGAPPTLRQGVDRGEEEEESEEE